MKSLLVLLVLSSISGSLANIPEEFKELADQLRKTCLNEIGVDEGLIADANKKNIADDPKLKCYMRCVMVELATIEDEKIDFDAIIAMIPPNMQSKIEPTVRSCSKITMNDDGCENAYQFNKCLLAEGPDTYFLI